jgi:hypothetical protein
VFYQSEFFGARSGAGPHSPAWQPMRRPVFARIEDLGGALKGAIGELGLFPYLGCIAYALFT